jgi:hypothetical protein
MVVEVLYFQRYTETLLVPLITSDPWNKIINKHPVLGLTRFTVMPNLDVSLTTQLDKAALARACYAHHCDENGLVVRYLSTVVVMI